MAEPVVAPTTLSWPCDDAAGYAALPGSTEQPYLQNGFLQMLEKDTGTKFLGSASSPSWDDNDANGVVSVVGDTVNGEPAWDVRALDEVAYRVQGVNLAGNNFTNGVWAGSVNPFAWTVTCFWFYDDFNNDTTRRWFLGNFTNKTTPRCGIMAHPGHPDPTKRPNYLFVTGFSSWTTAALTATEQIQTNVPRGTGWHFVMIAGLSVNPFVDVRVVTIDNTVVLNQTSGFGTLTLPRGTRFGTMYTGDYSAKRLYFDTANCLNELRYGSAAQILLPAARPESIQRVTSLTVNTITNQVDRHGVVQPYFRHSADGGATFPAGFLPLTLANLQAQVYGGDGRDVLQPMIVLSSSDSLVSRNGLFSPRLDLVQIGYQPRWVEGTSPAAAWTEGT